jgi:hypothetical protein
MNPVLIKYAQAGLKPGEQRICVPEAGIAIVIKVVRVESIQPNKDGPIMPGKGVILDNGTISFPSFPIEDPRIPMNPALDIPGLETG